MTERDPSQGEHAQNIQAIGFMRNLGEATAYPPHHVLGLCHVTDWGPMKILLYHVTDIPPSEGCYTWSKLC